jgi:hypothetical protein
MKKMMLLTAVVFAATMVLGTTAEAQTLALKPMFAKVACHASTATCVKMDLYQKMAATGSSPMAAASGASGGMASSRDNPVAARQNRSAAGGVENNPVDGGGGSALMRLSKNAARQVERITQQGRNRVAPDARNNQRSRSVVNPAVRNPLHRGGNPLDSNPTIDHTSAQTRPSAAGRSVNTMRPSAAERRYYNAVHQREITRHRPTDF